MEHEAQPDHLDDHADYALTRKILELETLYDVGMAIASVLDIATLTDEILTRLAVLLDLKAAFLLLMDEPGGQIRTAATYGIEKKSIVQLPLSNRADLFEEVMRTGQSRLLNDFDKHTEQSPCRHLILVPLKGRENILGVLGIMDKERDADVQAFTVEDERLAVAFANQAGIAIANARLYNHLQESNRRLESALTELQTAQQHIIQQERLRALGQMASGIVHDVNNAISAILGYTELWIMFPNMLDNKEKILHDLQTINTAAKDAAHITRRLRGFYRAREEGNKVMPVNLNEAVLQAIDISQPKWSTQAREQGITIKIETDLQPIPEIAGDVADLREMFVNLIFNAVDAMPENGVITFRTRRIGGYGRSTDGDHVVLEVNDTGAGMTEEVRQRCVEPFFSTKGERGTGMGLAMVFGIIQRHHGVLEIESEPGVGTLFRIRFPVPEPEPSAILQTADHILLQPIHALVVDDDPIQLKLMSHYLEGDGHRVVAAGSGREALEQFHQGQFDVVITDRLMPEMDGPHLARVIKRIAPSKPVILVTGEADTAEESSAHVNFILNKPVTLESFRHALATVIDRG